MTCVVNIFVLNIANQLGHTQGKALECIIDEWDCYFFEFESLADLVRAHFTLCMYICA